MLIDQLSPNALGRLSASELAKMEAVSRWDLADVKARVRERMGWTDELVEEAVKEYRKFLALIALEPNKTFGMVEVVDEVWHQHLLSTRDYIAMCKALVNGFIHHEQQPTGRNCAADYSDLRQYTLRALAEKFDGPISELWRNSTGGSYAKCCGGHISALPN